MLWLHDYGKIIDFENQYEATQKEGMKFLREIGFEQGFATKVLENIKLIDSSTTIDLHNASIEVKIVSSADGASHMVGPFFEVYLHENHHQPLEELMAGNRQKALKDWNKKIVLPEVKKAFERRHTFILEQNGDIPTKLKKKK